VWQQAGLLVPRVTRVGGCRRVDGVVVQASADVDRGDHADPAGDRPPGAQRQPVEPVIQ
jgi:hypothetical protein